MVKCWLTLALFAFLVWPARAHDWYPQECCHNQDCAPVACDSIGENGEGMTWNGLTFRGSQIRASPNAKCHACASKGKPSRPLCIFILPST